MGIISYKTCNIISIIKALNQKKKFLFKMKLFKNKLNLRDFK